VINMKIRFGTPSLVIQFLMAATLLSGCVLAGYRTPTADEPHAQLRVDTKDYLRILSLNEKGCIAHYKVLAEGPSFFGIGSSQSDPSVLHLLRTDQDAIMEYVSPRHGNMCRFHFSFRPEAGERYRLLGDRFIDPKGDTFFDKKIPAEKCGVVVVKEGAENQQTPVKAEMLRVDWTPACSRFITPEEASKKRPPAPPF
jgi:hypothetical protein